MQRISLFPVCSESHKVEEINLQKNTHSRLYQEDVMNELRIMSNSRSWISKLITGSSRLHLCYCHAMKSYSNSSNFSVKIQRKNIPDSVVCWALEPHGSAVCFQCSLRIKLPSESISEPEWQAAITVLFILSPYSRLVIRAGLPSLTSSILPSALNGLSSSLHINSPV